MNYPRFAFRLLLSRLRGVGAPLQLNVHVTDLCNLRCRYCYVDLDHPRPDLPLETLRKILGEARSCGTERVSLEGGEPLLRPDIGDIVDCVRELGIECNINTNGTLAARSIAKIRRADLLSVSLDGPQEVHDRLRGAGTFAKAVQGIAAAKAAGMKVHVMTTLTRHNYRHVGALLELARKLDFAWIPNSLFYPPGGDPRAPEAADCRIDDAEYRKLLQELIDRKALGDPIVWSRSTLEYVRDWPGGYGKTLFFSPEVPAGFTPLPCQAARFFCVMQTNGDLYSCDPLLGFGKAANAVALGFREALRRTTTNGCAACNSLVCTEYHQVFSLRLPVIWNLLRNYGHAVRRR
ncbi:MAG: hypothetical protein A2X36_15430 [Elusimicrobia bacterium GWA2_69_24]|nr:MAG: hypothetical protein A2X36_15430 [Elusimicrobia bacterium GWA2_69_24]